MPCAEPVAMWLRRHPGAPPAYSLRPESPLPDAQPSDRADPRPTQTARRLTGLAQATTPARRQRQPVRKRSHDNETGLAAYETEPGDDAGGCRDPTTTKLPARSTLVGSFGNPKRVVQGTTREWVVPESP